MMAEKKRVYMLDTIRGVLILGVVIYHLIFDLYYIFGLNCPWIFSPLADFIRDFGAGMFIFIAGISSRLSHNNYIRAAKTSVCALLLSLVTYIFIREEFIFLGILHFLAFMMLFYALLGRIIEKIPAIAVMVVNLIIFAFIVPFFLINPIPYELQINTWTYILGFGGGKLYSADYFPLLPWFFLFIGGTGAGFYVKEGKIPKFLYYDICKPITWIGRHTIIIYMLHQPIMYGILSLVFGLGNR